PVFWIFGAGRKAVRLESKKRYTHGLFLLDATHVPAACGFWPAFWTFGPNWPSSGEIDIMEGVNTMAENNIVLHTSPGCVVTGAGGTGAVRTKNCDVAAAGQAANEGCATATSGSLEAAKVTDAGSATVRSEMTV
ncbi:concanavalin A-like lectin/glucanase domain-containing protein, partial [Geopyxis carbonaria]